MTDKFELASRNKLRFCTSRGFLSTEELWDLSLQSLDTIARAVNKEVKQTEEESFIPKKKASSKQTELNLQLEILKHIIGEKVAEDERAKSRAQNRARVQQLKALATQKAENELSAKSLEEINAMIDSLGGDDEETE